MHSRIIRRRQQRPRDGAFRGPVATRKNVIPIDRNNYNTCDAAIEGNGVFRALLNQSYAEHPECFPSGIEGDFAFKDFMIPCALHPFIGVRDGCKRKYREQFEVRAFDIWHRFEARAKRVYARRWSTFRQTSNPL